MQRIIATTENSKAGIIRLILGGMFLMTGLMKLAIPALGEAFAGQLLAANIPFHEFNMIFVPVIEILVGAQLVVGSFARIGGLVLIALMIVASYVHLVVNDPGLFPLQPELPIMPLMVIAMSSYLVIVGGGTWSRDLKNS